MDLWSSLSENNASPRNLMLHNIDTSRNIEALRMGDWKMVNGKKYLVLRIVIFFNIIYFLN